MKITLLATLAILLLVSCDTTKDLVPAEACFNYLPNPDTYIGDPISFTNCSLDADSYLWNFGTGDTSSLQSPKYTYYDAGTYNVSLVAEGEINDTLNQSVIVKEYPSNFFVESDLYDLAWGITEYYGENEGNYYNVGLVLGAAGINLTFDNNTLTNVTGTDNIAIFNLYSSSPTELDEGTYHYSFNAGQMSFNGGAILMNYNAEQDTEDKIHELSSGYLVISKIDKLYNIEFSCSTFENKIVGGTFRGELVNLVYTNSSKSAKSGIIK